MFKVWENTTGRRLTRLFHNYAHVIIQIQTGVEQNRAADACVWKWRISPKHNLNREHVHKPLGYGVTYFFHKAIVATINQEVTRSFAHHSHHDIRQVNTRGNGWTSGVHFKR